MRIDRFEIIGELGAGAMGVVVEARDTQLDRTIALKLLKTISPKTRELLVREARALAKISDRNVVTVFDAGEHGDEVWIAMELCTGGSLRAWLREPRPWRAVVERFVAAGRGLAAAHAAGLVHRDFKPDNVLLDGRGGVRVGDFGLARSGEGVHADTTVAGTPAYMAPEQLLGGTVGPAADQFGFCVSLYDALYGHRPFSPAPELPTAASLVAEIVAARIVPPHARAAPRWLHAITVRGLAADPDRRWPSMDAVIAALERGLTRGRRIRAVAGTAVAIGATALATVVLTREPSEQPCAMPEQRAARVWSSLDRSVLAARFTSLDVAPAFAVVANELDGYARRSTAAWSDACTATHVARSQDAEALALREACLRDGLSSLGATVVVLHSATADELRLLATRPLRLPPPEACGDLQLLRETFPPPANPALRARVAVLRGSLDEIDALSRLGRTAEAKQRVEPAVVEARALAYAPLLATALLRRGNLVDRQGDYPSAERDLFEASTVAEAGRVHHLTAQARLALGYLVGKTRGDVPAGLRWLDLADAACKAANRPDLASTASSYRGLLLFQRGDLDGALAAHRQAVAAAEGADEDTILVARFNLARELHELGRSREARELLAAVCTRLRAIKPADHPDLLDCLAIDVGAAQLAGDVAAARRDTLLVLEGYRRIYGPRSYEVSLAEANLAAILIDSNQFAEARRHAESSLAIAREIQRPDGDRVLFAVQILSVVLLRQHELPQARTLLESAIAAALPGAGDAGVRNLRVNLSGVLLNLGDCAPVIRMLEPMLATASADGGNWISTARWNLGQCLNHVGRSAEAVAALATAHREAVAKGDVELAASIRHSRARVLLALGRRSEALTEARGALADLPAQATVMRESITQWIAKTWP